MMTSRSRIVGETLLGVLLAGVAVTEARSQDKPDKPPPAHAQRASEEDHARWALRTPEQAIIGFGRIAGFLKDARPTMSAELVTLTKDDTPFLHDQIVGRPIWHIVIPQWKLRLKSARDEAGDRYARTFDVLLDPRDGKVLKILSRWPKDAPPIAPQPPAESAEAQMKSAGLEKYDGFPEVKPQVSFLEALDVVYRDGGLGDPLISKQILAHCVMRSAMGGESKAVWAITLRGFPPFEASHPGVPVDARNHARHIVDAKTGEWICAGTSPQPVEPAPAPPREEEGAERKTPETP